MKCLNYIILNLINQITTWSAFTCFHQPQTPTYPRCAPEGRSRWPSKKSMAQLFSSTLRTRPRRQRPSHQTSTTESGSTSGTLGWLMGFHGISMGLTWLNHHNRDLMGFKDETVPDWRFDGNVIYIYMND